MQVNQTIVSGRVLHAGLQDGFWLGVLLCDDQYIPFRSSQEISKGQNLVLQGKFCGLRDAELGKVRSFLDVLHILPLQDPGSHSDDTPQRPPAPIPVSEPPLSAASSEPSARKAPSSTDPIVTMEEDLVFTGPLIPWPL